MKKMMIFVLLFSATLHAEIYKWVNDKGQIQYGDKPVDNAKKIDIVEEASKVNIVNKKQRQEKRNRLLESFAADRKEKNKKQVKIRKKQKRLQKSCVRAKDRLRHYQRASSLYNLDNKGNRITLSYKRRENTIQKLKASIRRHCK